jgi:hypothetical protein
MNMDVCLRADKTMRANSAAADFAFIYFCMCAERLGASFHLSHAAKCDETNSISRRIVTESARGGGANEKINSAIVGAT